MNMRTLQPQSKITRFVRIASLAVILFVLIFYSFLLAQEGYSARESSMMLDRLERLRMGDPAGDFEQAVRGCKIEKTDSEYFCGVTAGAFRIGWPWILMWRLPDEWAYKVSEFRDRAGLRFWRLTASASVLEGHVQLISGGFFVVGRYETLGANWQIIEPLPARYRRQTNPDQLRTYMGWFHITSVPSGEGFRIEATADSTGKELLARRINRKCLFSFRGCDGLCELLPDAIPVLKDRAQSWGGCTSVPRSHC